MMKSTAFNRKLLNSLRYRKDITVFQHNLNYDSASYRFLKIISKKIRPQDKIVLITAGIHGEEKAGPITLLENLNRILDRLQAYNLKAIIYPAINPFGFEENVRYNLDSDLCGIQFDPNDFMRYIQRDGTVTSDLKAKDVFKEWLWSSEENLDLTLPQETRLLHRLLKKDPLHQVVAAIDLHQDFITKNVKSAAYHYIYRNFSEYFDIYRRIDQIVPLLRNTYIDAGFDNGGMVSDSNASIIRYDGTLSDLMHRVGVKHVVTVETTGTTPLNEACEVNLAWIMGIIDLIAKEKNSENIKDSSVVSSNDKWLQCHSDTLKLNCRICNPL